MEEAIFIVEFRQVSIRINILMQINWLSFLRWKSGKDFIILPKALTVKKYTLPTNGAMM